MKTSGAVTILVVGALMGGIASAADSSSDWNSAGGNLQNTRFQASEKRLTVTNVDQLEAKWEFITGGDVSATPAVQDDTVYFPDRAGNLYAVNKWSGQQKWSTTIASATHIPGDYSRTTPALGGNKLIVGTQGPFGGGGNVLAFNKNTGALIWQTQLDDHPAAIITQSATVYGNRVYVGTSSLEETLAAVSPGYVCCSFRGKMAALDLATGAVLWETIMTPVGFPGNAVWGSSPAIDAKRGQLYIATGNNYDAPQATLDCITLAGNDPAAQRACLPADNHFDSVLALDLKTGAIRWATRMLGFDAWTVACIFGDPSNCPSPAGPDFDFGQAPALFTVREGNRSVDVVGAGQKSGQYWTLNPDTGAVRWMTQAGPGGTAGGLQWGSAVDGKRIYTANPNSNHLPFTPFGSTTTSTQGVWSGIDAVTGQLLWQTPNEEAGSFFGGGSSGPVTTANGVVFGCTLDATGHMYALDGATGRILWRFASGGACLSGAAISEGRLFWGSGYSTFGDPSNNKLYSFGLPG